MTEQMPAFRKWGLRILMGWWVVPFAWIVVSPIEYLISGDVDNTLEVTDILWYGRYDILHD